MTESAFLFKEACPSCGSKDNLARYDDGHAHCFSPGCGYREKPTGEAPTQQRERGSMSGLVTGEVKPLLKRGINEETCAKFGYIVGQKASGEKVQLAPYFKDGKLVAQHYRTAAKDFGWIGDSKDVDLFGQHLWRDAGKMVVITEGEIDAMTVSQLQGNKWPVVSLPNGAQSAKKCVARALEWLENFDSVILMFDMDEPGRIAVEECAQLFKPGKCKVASLPLKDANEMLLAGRGAEVIDAVWGAKEFRPDGIVTLADLKDDLNKTIENGLPWVFPTLNELTHGRRYGELYAVGAGTGVGKTDVLTQQVEYDISVLKQPVGLFFLEQTPVETGKRLAGKHANKLFHIPGAGWTQDELHVAVDKLIGAGNCYLYDSWGATEWDSIKSRIRFLRHAQGVRIFYLDHLTALAAAEDDERTALERIMSEMAALAKELQVVIIFVSHLATPEGKPHEEGGRVMIRHFKGSRAIGFWSHYMIGLERDQQAPDEKERQRTTVRLLKARFDGSKTGSTFFLGYDVTTGRLSEVSEEEFVDETAGKPQEF